MVVTARGAITYAVNGWLRSFPELTALVDTAAGWTDGRTGSPRISSRVQGEWKMPTRALVVRRSGGPVVGDDYALGLKTTRFDTFCYAGSGYEAEQLWARLDAVLVPTDGRAASFVSHGVRIVNVQPETDAAEQVEPDSGWIRVFAPYIVVWGAAG